MSRAHHVIFNVYGLKYCNNAPSNVLLTLMFSGVLFPESAEFTRPAAWVRGWSEGQREKLFSHSLRGGQRDPELHQESRNPGSEVTLDSLAAGRIRPSGQKRTTRNQLYHRLHLAKCSFDAINMSGWKDHVTLTGSIYYCLCMGVLSQAMRRTCSSWVQQPSMLNGLLAPCWASPARASVPQDPAQPAEPQPQTAVSPNHQQRAATYKNQR